MKEKTAIVVGCGSVGSHIAAMLAKAGVGRLILVDKDSLSPANIHRHLLGMDSVGEAKVEAMRSHLVAQHPYLDVDARPVTFEQYLPELAAARPDVVIFATGEHSVELHASAVLHDLVPLVHVWLEPLGLGCHALSSVPGDARCLRCVFEDDPVHGLHCALAFAAPNQDFTTVDTTCGGAFMPFSVVDVSTAAGLGAREAVRLLTADGGGRALSRRGSPGLFTERGFALSARGQNSDEFDIVVLRMADLTPCSLCQKDAA